MAKALKRNNEYDSLKGWREIAGFLGQPVSVAQRWVDSGMPVQRRGRYVYGSREELKRWLSRESSQEPVQIVTEDIDLESELRRGLGYLRKQGSKSQQKRAA